MYARIRPKHTNVAVRLLVRTDCSVTGTCAKVFAMYVHGGTTTIGTPGACPWVSVRLLQNSGLVYVAWLPDCSARINPAGSQIGPAPNEGYRSCH